MIHNNGHFYSGHLLEYIPVIGPVVGFWHFIRPHVETEKRAISLTDRTCTYLAPNSLSRTIVLLIPILGALCIALYDFQNLQIKNKLYCTLQDFELFDPSKTQHLAARMISLISLPASQWHLIPGLDINYFWNDDSILTQLLETNPKILLGIYRHLDNVLSTGTSTQIKDYIKFITTFADKLLLNQDTKGDPDPSIQKNRLLTKMNLIHMINKKNESYEILKENEINELDEKLYIEEKSLFIYLLQKMSLKDIPNSQNNDAVISYLKKKIQDRKIYRDNYIGKQQALAINYYVVTQPKHLNTPNGTIQYLDGTTEEIPYDVPMPTKLQENMESAKRIIDFLDTEFFYSTNHAQRTPLTRELSLSAMEELAAIRERNIHSPYYSSVKSAKELFHIGNCGELSRAGLKYAQKQDVASVERFFIAKGDHSFLVIGRCPTSSPSNYKQWGPDAVICDPWARTYFPASKIETFLNDYTQVTLYQEKEYTQVTLFNPQKQTLRLAP